MQSRVYNHVYDDLIAYGNTGFEIIPFNSRICTMLKIPVIKVNKMKVLFNTRGRIFYWLNVIK